MRELEARPDALERHLAMRERCSLLEPPRRAQQALDLFDALTPDEADAPLAALREYTVSLDAHAHAGDPERNERTLRSLDPQRFQRAFAPLLLGDPRMIPPWMGALLALDRAAAIRSQPAFARGGLHRYSLAQGQLEARWTDGLTRVIEGEHRIVRGARWYFDAIFLHPFDDGNARLARALFTASLEDRAAVDLAAPVWLPKRPGVEEDFWRFVTVCARSASARERQRYHRRDHG